MKDDDILFCQEDIVAGFLGVHIDHQKDSTIQLTQSGLAQRILEVLHFTDTTVDPVIFHVLNIYPLMMTVRQLMVTIVTFP